MVFQAISVDNIAARILEPCVSRNNTKKRWRPLLRIRCLHQWETSIVQLWNLWNGNRAAKAWLGHLGYIGRGSSCRLKETCWCTHCKVEISSLRAETQKCLADQSARRREMAWQCGDWLSHQKKSWKKDLLFRHWPLGKENHRTQVLKTLQKKSRVNWISEVQSKSTLGWNTMSLMILIMNSLYPWASGCSSSNVPRIENSGSFLLHGRVDCFCAFVLGVLGHSARAVSGKGPKWKPMNLRCLSCRRRTSAPGFADTWIA